MNRTTNIFAGFLLLITPLALAQEGRPTPQFPEDALATQQLIAWTRMQKPQPAPQPLPPRDTPEPQPDQQGKQAADPQQTPSQQTPTSQSFSGRIVKDGNKYVLKAANNATYESQEQDVVQEYENQNVKVIGSIDAGTNTIRVVKIELLS